MVYPSNSCSLFFQEKRQKREEEAKNAPPASTALEACTRVLESKVTKYIGFQEKNIWNFLMFLILSLELLIQKLSKYFNPDRLKELFNPDRLKERFDTSVSFIMIFSSCFLNSHHFQVYTIFFLFQSGEKSPKKSRTETVIENKKEVEIEEEEDEEEDEEQSYEMYAEEKFYEDQEEEEEEEEEDGYDFGL